MTPKVFLFSALIAAVALSPFFAIAEKIEAVPAAEAADAKKTSTPAGWTDDFEAAKKQAEAEDKDLFVVFSGTDWCSWCVRLEKDILSKDGVLEKISENFVPVFIDVPQDESRLSELAKTQNRPLAERYRIQGFPTVLLMDPDGIVFARTGYTTPDTDAYLKDVAELLAAGKVSSEYKTRKAILAVPADAADRVKQLDELLAPQPIPVQLDNISCIEEILAADPDGALGFRAKYPYFTTVLPLENQTRALLLDLQKKASEYFRNADQTDQDAAANDALFRAVSENAEALTALRERVRQAREQTVPESFGEKRLAEIDAKLGEILTKFGHEQNLAAEKEEK